MIIELFGPPGVGKTTFARALTARLRDRGQLAELRLSSRPSECLSGLDPCEPSAGPSHVIRRLSRPLVEMLTIARHPLANSRDVRMAINLISVLPPTSIFSVIKNSQYISRLAHSWRERARIAHILVFDQAFVQAVCSLALLARAADDRLIAEALDYAPKSDLLIYLAAPAPLVEARLHERRRLQSAIEQLFEPSLERSIASIFMTDRLHNLLLKRGRSVLCASSLDQRSLRESLDMIESEVVAKCIPAYRGAA